MSEEKDSGPPENADKSQEVSGIYIPFPVTDEQAARMYGAYCASELASRGEATEAALRVAGIEITPPPEDLKTVAYVNAQRLRWKLSTGSSVCLTFSAEPWHGGGSQDLIDGIVFSKDQESVVRHLNVCLSEQERAILGLTDQIAEKDRRIAELEGEIDLARQSPAPPLETESGEHDGDGATSALSDTLRAAAGKAANDIRHVQFVTNDERGPRLDTIKPSYFRFSDHLIMREICEDLVRFSYSLSRTAGMSAEDVVRLTVGRVFDGAEAKMVEAITKDEPRQVAARDFLSAKEIREIEFLNGLKDIIKSAVLAEMDHDQITAEQIAEKLGYDPERLSEILNPDLHISSFDLFDVMDRLSLVWVFSSRPMKDADRPGEIALSQIADENRAIDPAPPSVNVKRPLQSRDEQIEQLAKAIRRMWRSSDTSAKDLAAQHIAEAEQRVVEAISAKIATIPAKPMGEHQALAIAMDLATTHILEAEDRGREERSLYPHAPLIKKTASGDGAECNPRVLAAAKAMCLACYGEDLWARIPNQDEWILRAALAVSAADDVEWQPIEIAPEEEFWARNGKIVSLVKKHATPEGVVLAGWGHKHPPTEWRDVPPPRF
ncbi:hypothetical protein AA14337_3072 [Acetobacter malorum DSM 14337]|uniref:Uncharacterized protein n=1 Tax=Acetobacter malorum DSM 14337 TaxID=1307910 RepID=A0ABQ0PZH5_9PROT|nr:hypothetical protein [Acetobacter malorum]KXV05660.1 hypothetical protein AD930_11025 [Acetobacter malorum]GBQ85440.1 hypothetical protein AA14337_3072 [Acetobacter malorum DSM 14337]